MMYNNMHSLLYQPVVICVLALVVLFFREKKDPGKLPTLGNCTSWVMHTGTCMTGLKGTS